MRAALLGAAALVLIAGPAAAELSVRSGVDAQTVGIDDHLQFTVTLEGGDGQVPAPVLKNLTVVGGPSVSTSVSWINGAISQSRSYTWVLRGVAPGPAEIGEVRVQAGGVEKVAPAIAVEIVAGSVKPRTRRSSPLDPWGDEDPFEQFFGRQRRRPGPEPKLFVEAVAERSRVYVGEPVLVTYYLYTQTQVTDFAFGEAPTFPGFWSEELEQPRGSIKASPVTVEGEQYQRAAIFKKLLFPTKAGTLTLPAASIRIGVPRGAFGGTAVVERPTKALTITAEVLPDDPAFSGAVGQFQASTTIDKASVALGDAATVTFSIEGSGNLKWVERAPTLDVPGAKVYPPEAKSDIKVTPAGTSGRRTWTFVVVPETRGTLEIPGIPFTYFDPKPRQLVRTLTKPLSLTVEGGTAPAGFVPAAPSASRAAGAPVLRSDLDLPIRGLAFAPGALGLIVAGVLLLHGLVWGMPILLERRAPIAHATAKRSVRAAVRELERAGRNGMTKEASIALIEKTLHEVFGPLEDGGPDGERERAARRVLEDVRFIRYAPQLGDYSEKIQDVARRAADVVRRHG